MVSALGLLDRGAVDPGHAGRLPEDVHRRRPVVQELGRLRARHGAVPHRLRQVLQHRVRVAGPEARRATGWPPPAASLGLEARGTSASDVFTGKVSTGGSPAEQAAASFGQGTTLVSPLAMAGATAAVARGQFEQPQAGARPGAGQARRRPARSSSPSPSTALRTMMREVVTAGTGSALRGRARAAPVYGKTGTAEYDDNPAHTHAWFVGWQGDVAFAVFVEKGGASTAAPSRSPNASSAPSPLTRAAGSATPPDRTAMRRAGAAPIADERSVATPRRPVTTGPTGWSRPPDGPSASSAGRRVVVWDVLGRRGGSSEQARAGRGGRADRLPLNRGRDEGRDTRSDAGPLRVDRPEPRAAPAGPRRRGTPNSRPASRPADPTSDGRAPEDRRAGSRTGVGGIGGSRPSDAQQAAPHRRRGPAPPNESAARPAPDESASHGQPPDGDRRATAAQTSASAVGARPTAERRRAGTAASHAAHRRSRAGPAIRPAETIGPVGRSAGSTVGRWHAEPGGPGRQQPGRHRLRGGDRGQPRDHGVDDLGGVRAVRVVVGVEDGQLDAQAVRGVDQAGEQDLQLGEGDAARVGRVHGGHHRRVEHVHVDVHPVAGAVGQLLVRPLGACGPRPRPAAPAPAGW